MILPDRLTLLLAGTGVCHAAMIGKPDIVEGVLGALFAFALLWAGRGAFRRYRGADGLGFGDLKFSAAAGLWIGWQQVTVMLLIASSSALIFVAARSWRQRKLETTLRLPFGPFLGLGLPCAGSSRLRRDRRDRTRR